MQVALGSCVAFTVVGSLVVMVEVRAHPVHTVSCQGPATIHCCCCICNVDGITVTQACLYSVPRFTLPYLPQLSDPADGPSLAPLITSSLLTDHRVIVDHLVFVGLGDLAVDPRGGKLRGAARDMHNQGLPRDRVIVSNRWTAAS